MSTFRTSAPIERAHIDAKYRTSWQRERRDGRIAANDNSYGGRLGLAIMIAAPVLIFGGFFVIGRLF